MPRKPKDEGQAFLDERRRKIAERRGTPVEMHKGRPNKRRNVTFYDLAERVAAYRDNGVPVEPKDVRAGAIWKVWDDVVRDEIDKRLTIARVRKAWESLREVFGAGSKGRPKKRRRSSNFR